MKNNKCRICNQEMHHDDKYIIVKEKMLYNGDDGCWFNFNKAIICWECIKKIRNEISQAK